MFEYSTFISLSFIPLTYNMLHYYDKKLFAYLRHLGRFGAFADAVGRELEAIAIARRAYMKRAGFRKI